MMCLQHGLFWKTLPSPSTKLAQCLAKRREQTYSPEQQHALQEAIAAYITPALVQAINEARIRLGQYIPDEEAEALSEHIAYWDYATLPKRLVI